MPGLRPFQRQFVRAIRRPGVQTGALSIPRGNGKSWLAAHIAADAMRAIGAHQEVALAAASIEQGRIVFRFCRQLLGEDGWRYLDSSTRCGITRGDGARLRVIGSNGRTAMGLVNTPLVVADEPGSWETRGGELMHDAIQTAQGKPGSPLQVVYIGTLAPAQDGWWHDLVRAGSHGSTYVQVLQGDRSTWDQWPTIRKCNPLCNIDAGFRRKLLEERDAARRDSRLQARFLSYRLNQPTRDEAEVLLQPADWERVIARPVPPREGQPLVAYDLGGGRAWSAAVAVWRNGRLEARAVAPGIPSIQDQERRDRVPSGTYQRLVAAGLLDVADGLHVQQPAHLHELAFAAWGWPVRIVCDRFRLLELTDVVNGIPLEARRSRWSEAAADVRATRQWASDGPLACDERSRPLVTAALAASEVKSDDQGSTRLVKRGSNNQARDDVAAAMVLAIGAMDRELRRPAPDLYAYEV